MSDATDVGVPPPLGLMEEIRSLPRMHRVLVYVAIVCLLLMCVEGALLVPYIVLRWGWGYSL